MFVYSILRFVRVFLWECQTSNMLTSTTMFSWPAGLLGLILVNYFLSIMKHLDKTNYIRSKKYNAIDKFIIYIKY